MTASAVELDKVADDVDATMVARARDRGLLGYLSWAAIIGDVGTAADRQCCRQAASRR